MVGGGYTQTEAEEVLHQEEADVVAFGTAFIANPDLVDRFRVGAELAAADEATFYGGGSKGYAEYPTHTAHRTA